jgi:hypothetical protein
VPYVVPEFVLSATTPDGEVLLNTRSGQYHFLNPTGEAVLAALRSGEPVRAAAERIATETGAEVEAVTADCEAFVAELRGRGLVE